MGFKRLIIPIVFILITLLFFIGTLNLPKARLGDPEGPMYFPMMVSIFLFIVSVIYLIKEYKNSYPQNEEIQLLFKGRAPLSLLIVSTLVLSFIYALIFEKLGFLISTILFLMAILFIVNGRKKWIVNISVSVLFSLGTWYAFGTLLGVSLP
ncbi:tripartite tricarboxylate transporter TctB family protein [Bacillus sp. DJP31]|uniref:tripartite tricarboxylate transporter TctB family protein n=1 Tax=Bacillus sp. DJP31 TaxID=3409789 RepID=UPI003BB4E38A